MTTPQDTINLLEHLLEALAELNRTWDEIEAWSDAVLSSR